MGLCYFLSKDATEVKICATGEVFRINQSITCSDENGIYLLTCLKCKEDYTGKTVESFKTRCMSHRRDIIEKADKSLARHFNGRGHSIKDMLFIGIEIVHSKDPYVLGARERYYPFCGRVFSGGTVVGYKKYYVSLVDNWPN